MIHQAVSMNQEPVISYRINYWYIPRSVYNSETSLFYGDQLTPLARLLLLLPK